MVIEWLKFWVEPQYHQRFLHWDAALWTAALATCPGYHSKEIWQDPADPCSLIVVIRWHDRQQWKAIDPQFLAQVEQAFTEAMGNHYQLQEMREFDPVLDPSLSSDPARSRG
ncbi:TIGR03792 family protein [Prochlorothrix hollandica]|uniref:Uncharacterized protein n=1 Tax=Prochlorothrix hollandica PCC 9006 = CALU 1027 TaxID=317619 RepID=A0A0M2Q377_PROHO|nr:TIGR03792 family protein [Prochlorothrix hollandica]KKJ01713.1 hypothetical protein PROH_04450 [Prochlorothrix hollandica PCC 9006 = CALU 1027]